MKKNNGMGIIKLILMVVLIVVVVATAVYFTRKKYREVKAETIRTDMLQVQWKLKDYIDKQTVKGEEKKYLGTKISEMQDNEIIKDLLAKNIISEEEYDKYYVLQDENLAEAGLEITNYEGSYFLINYNTYEVIDTKGPDHDKTFTAEVKLNGKVLATGEGKTKKQAEMNAADKALKNL